MAKLTKKREGDCWRVCNNGKRTLLLISKDANPFDAGFTHAVYRADSFLFETQTLTATWARLEILASELG